MGEIYLATGGSNGIKLWSTDGSRLTLNNKLHFTKEDAPSLCWSADNQFLANCSDSGKQINIRRLSIGDEIKLNNEEYMGKTCISFDSSNNLLAGGKDGIVYTWDIKNRKIRHFHKAMDSSISSMQYNYEDSLLAAGFENGDVMIYKTLMDSFHLLPRASKSSITCLRFSNFHFNLLAATSFEGFVFIYDVRQKEIYHSYKNQHSSPATAVAFSPHNNKLMLSVGLDKKIICYDVSSKSFFKSISCEDQITSLDLHHNGHTVAVGTVKGQIILYDLRKLSSPTLNLSAHDPPVFCLKFENKTASLQRSKPKVEAHESAQAIDHHSSMDATSKDLSADIFSPFRSEAKEASHTKSSPKQSFDRPLKDNFISHETMHLATPSLVFSPVGDGAPQHHLEKIMPKGGPTSQAPINFGDLSKKKVSLISDVLATIPVRIRLDTEESFVQKQEGNLSDAHEKTSEQYLLDDDENQVGAAGAMNSSMHSFPVELIRQIVRSEVEDCFEQLHKGFLNLHVEIVKKFHEQQVLLQQLIQSANMEPHLLNEIKKLKEENDNLKNHFKLC